MTIASFRLLSNSVSASTIDDDDSLFFTRNIRKNSDPCNETQPTFINQSSISDLMKSILIQHLSIRKKELNVFDLKLTFCQFKKILSGHLDMVSFALKQSKKFMQNLHQNHFELKFLDHSISDSFGDMIAEKLRLSQQLQRIEDILESLKSESFSPLFFTKELDESRRSSTTTLNGNDPHLKLAIFLEENRNHLEYLTNQEIQLNEQLIHLKQKIRDCMQLEKEISIVILKIRSKLGPVLKKLWKIKSIHHPPSYTREFISHEKVFDSTDISFSFIQNIRSWISSKLSWFATC